MKQKSKLSSTEQLLAGGSFRNWLRLLCANGVEAPYLCRALFVTVTSLMCSPLRLLERALYGRAFDAVEIDHPPLFIIGHVRTGTTHLHNLISHDPNFGFLSTIQAGAPNFSLTASRFLRPLFRWGLRDTRYMDNMSMSLDSPQEEEIALARVSPHSLYHWWCFPKRMRFYFDRYGLFDDLPDETLETWKRHYLELLKRTTYHAQGRRLVLKNPANTGRIRVLLDLFPYAQFVHIYRNPYVVYPSTKHLHRKMLEIFSFQDYDEDELEAFVLYSYERVMKRFFEDRALIPQGNIVDVRFEDLESDPLGQLRRIYTELGLPGFEKAEPVLRDYIDSQSSYRKNVFRLQPDEIDRIGRHWRFALDRWGYDVPPEITTPDSVAL